MSKLKRITRHYDAEFKRRAVKLYRSSNKSYAAIASDLGIPAATLVGWVQNPKYSHCAENTPEVASVELLQEMKALRRELADTKEERDILKKALAIFSTDDPKR